MNEQETLALRFRSDAREKLAKVVDARIETSRDILEDTELRKRVAKYQEEKEKKTKDIEKAETRLVEIGESMQQAADEQCVAGDIMSAAKKKAQEAYDLACKEAWEAMKKTTDAIAEKLKLLEKERETATKSLSDVGWEFLPKQKRAVPQGEWRKASTGLEVYAIRGKLGTEIFEEAVQQAYQLEQAQQAAHFEIFSTNQEDGEIMDKLEDRLKDIVGGV